MVVVVKGPVAPADGGEGPDAGVLVVMAVVLVVGMGVFAVPVVSMLVVSSSILGIIGASVGTAAGGSVTSCA